jgi:PPOX class probable F420-dependent enzyme
MSAERLDDARIQRFLATKEVIVLATLEPDGAPLAMPMWFLHDPEAITMISVAATRKVKNLVRDGRVCVVAEAGTRGAEIRNLTVRGRAEQVPDGTPRRDLARRFLEKYHPHLEALWGGRAMPPDRVMFRIVPERVRSRGL